MGTNKHLDEISINTFMRKGVAEGLTEEKNLAWIRVWLQSCHTNASRERKGGHRDKGGWV